MSCHATDVPGCNVGNVNVNTDEIVCDYENAAIASPNYPLPYVANARQMWRITTRSGTFIHLRFHDFDVVSVGPRYTRSYGFGYFKERFRLTIDHGDDVKGILEFWK